MYKYELHSHTAECDLYAEVSGSEMVKLYIEKGYSGMVITDHYFAAFYDWFKKDISPFTHEKIIGRYLKGYYSAKNEAEKTDFKVFCGAEVRFDGYDNDYLVYGLCENDFYNLPLLNKLKNVEELKSVLPETAIIIQAHPFRDGMVVESPENIFGVEGYNGATPKIRGDMAKLFAGFYDKAITSGSDFHSVRHLAKGGIICSEKINTSDELVKLIKSGKYSLIEN